MIFKIPCLTNTPFSCHRHRQTPWSFFTYVVVTVFPAPKLGVPSSHGCQIKPSEMYLKCIHLVPSFSEHFTASPYRRHGAQVPWQHVWGLPWPVPAHRPPPSSTTGRSERCLVPWWHALTNLLCLCTCCVPTAATNVTALSPLPGKYAFFSLRSHITFHLTPSLTSPG